MEDENEPKEQHLQIKKQVIFYLTNVDYWKKCENANLAEVKDPYFGVIDSDRWARATEYERYRLLCAFFSMIIGGIQSRNQFLEDEVKKLHKLVHERCVWKDDE